MLVSIAVLCTHILRSKIVRGSWRLKPFLRAKVVLVVAVLSSLLLLFTVSGAGAQGCAMCYQSAAASGAAGRAALRHGILVLLVPAVGLFCGILVLMYRRAHPAQPRRASRPPQCRMPGRDEARLRRVRVG